MASPYEDVKNVDHTVDPDYAFTQTETDVHEPGEQIHGELKYEEYTKGGLGRHLGIISTTFLVCVHCATIIMHIPTPFFFFFFSKPQLLTYTSRVGRIIGTGIFSTPSSVTEELGSVGASLMFWVLGFVLSASGLCVWLEFGSMIPRSGGEKNYLEAVYTKPKMLITVVFAVQAIALGFTGWFKFSNCFLSNV